MNLIEPMIMHLMVVKRKENLLSIVHTSVCGDSLKRIWQSNCGGPQTSLENYGYRDERYGDRHLTLSPRSDYLKALVSKNGAGYPDPRENKYSGS